MTTTDTIHLEPGNQDIFDEYAELYNSVNSYDNTDHMDFSGEYFQSSYTSLNIDMNRDIALVRSSQGDLIGSGVALPHNTSPNSIRILIHVHPIHRRKGIGSMIMRYFLRTHSEKNNTEFHCRIFSFRPHAIVFAMNHGFTHNHTWIKMRYNNKAENLPTHQSWKLKIRELNIETELKLWADLQNRIFHSSPGYEYVTAESMKDLFNHICFDPKLVLVAELGDKPVGICMGWSLKSSDVGIQKKILQIQGMGILPGYRREGYASTLLLELMNRAYLKGHTLSELLVLNSNKAGIRMYEKIGFTKPGNRLWYQRHA